MVQFSLARKNILITGASSGIGATTSIACSNSGANIILLGRNQDKLEAVYSKLNQGNNSVLSYDLNNIEGLEKALGELLNKYGKIHGFIHSAGIDVTKPLSFLRCTDYNTLFDVNVISGFEIARILSKKLFCPAEGSSYIFISSVMGTVGETAKIAYSASKGALLGGCKSMALELAPKKIRVNCISPAIVRTELVDKLFNELPVDAFEKIKSFHPLGFGSPIDVANACIFLLSNEAKWITGSNLVVDGGYSCQ